jgi:hypothetical protein
MALGLPRYLAVGEMGQVFIPGVDNHYRHRHRSIKFDCYLSRSTRKVKSKNEEKFQELQELVCVCAAPTFSATSHSTLDSHNGRTGICAGGNIVIFRGIFKILIKKI